MWDAVITAGGGLLGGILGQGASATEARRLRKWQENLSNTAHQRQVRDLQAAGLNPILSAFGSGASVPTGAMAQVPNYGELAVKGAQAGLQMASARQAIKYGKAQTAQAEVTARHDQQMAQWLKENPKLKAAFLAARAARNAGLPATFGAAASSNSAKAIKAIQRFGSKAGELFFNAADARRHQAEQKEQREWYEQWRDKQSWYKSEPLIHSQDTFNPQHRRR